MKGQSGSAKLSVILNGKKLSGRDNYTCTLQSGDNRIRLYAKDGDKKIDRYFTVTYVPIADDTTRPEITYINVTNGQTVKGSGFTLRFNAQDYQAEGYMPTRPRSGSMGFLLSVSHRTGTQPIISSFRAGQIFLK